MNKLKYEDRIIAFVDILGFKDIIKESDRNKHKLKLIYEALDFLKNRENSNEWNLKFVEIEEDAQKKGVHNFDISNKTNCTCFSDTIVVSVISDSEKINEIVSTLIINLSYIGSKLLSEGILIRGGLTIGKLIHNNTGVIMGQGLIDAYELENRVAKFPRIVLSNALIQKLNYPIDTKRNRYPYHQYLKRFEDGCVGFHQMIYFEVIQSWVEMNDIIMKTELEKIKQVIIVGLDGSFEKPDIFEKYNWLKRQYNELIIFPNNFENITEENINKELIEKIVDASNHQNIHFSYYNPTAQHAK
jgi:hypothetical protein